MKTPQKYHSFIRIILFIITSFMLFAGSAPANAYVGADWTQRTTAAGWSGRMDVSTLTFNNKMWVFGGTTCCLMPSDVWSSSDGVTWTQVTASAPWAGRFAQAAVVFNNKMWIMGGVGTGGGHDVWSSSDGVTWTQATSAAAWPAREYFTVLAYNNKMWVMGGENSSGVVKHDVWSSSDGVTWTQATAAAGWSARHAFGGVVKNNKMWIMGGQDGGSTFYNDVWSSTDGITWTQATAAAAWPARPAMGTLVYNNKMWVMGGVTYNYWHDVWSSTDGITWTQETPSASWSGRSQFGAVVLNNKIWVMGGETWTGRKNDVWSSDTTGVTWTQATPAAAWKPTQAFGAVAFNNKMWMMGGVAGNAQKVWSSSDGVTWNSITSAPAWSARNYFELVVFNNKMWVMGGHDAGGLKNDVWSSSDGITWTQATAAAGWSARSGFRAVIFNNKIWVMGGDDGTKKHDVWSSSDGITWTQATGAAGWSARGGSGDFGAVTYNNKVWVMGGNDGSPRHDVWSSTDGVTWNQVTLSAGWSPRFSFGTLVFDNEMWVMGGQGFGGGSGGQNDVWSSTNGINWTKATTAAGWATRQNFGWLVLNNRMWVMGGETNPGLLNDVWYTGLPTGLGTATDISIGNVSRSPARKHNYLLWIGSGIAGIGLSGITLIGGTIMGHRRSKAKGKAKSANVAVGDFNGDIKAGLMTSPSSQSATPTNRIFHPSKKLVVLAVVVGVIGGGGLYIFDRWGNMIFKKNSPTTNIPIPSMYSSSVGQIKACTDKETVAKEYKLFRSDTYKYCIQYPMNWPVNSTKADMVTFGAVPSDGPGPGWLKVTYFTGKTSVSRTEEIKDLNKEPGGPCTTSDVMLAGETAKKLDCISAATGGHQIFYLVTEDENLIELSYMESMSTDKTSYNTQYGVMVKSFLTDMLANQ
jgi:hypothetical protein